MVVVGAILLVLCLVLGVGLSLADSAPITAETFGITFTNVSFGALFLLGIVIGAVAVLALGMVLGGAARKRRKKSAMKREVRTAHSEQETLAEQNARLQAELERERTASLPDGGATTDGSGTRERL